MSAPVWTLLAFAVWTLFLLFTTVGVYRWTRIPTGRIGIAEWRADEPQGSDWYRRAVRAHMNCVENLPIYSAIVVALVATGVTGPTLNALAVTLIVARICQSIIHVGFQQTNTVAAIRFMMFFVQAICMLSMAAVLIASVNHA